jgi:outer membrane protein TolC
MSPEPIGTGRVRRARAFASPRALWLLAALGCGWPRVHAQDEATRTVTLAEVLRHAHTRAPEVRAALAALDRLEGERALAQAAYLPRVVTEVTSGAAYSNRRVVPGVPRVVSTSLQTRASAGVEWVALDVSRGHEVEQAEAARRAQQASAESTRLDAVYSAAALYFRAGAAAQLVADARTTLARRSEQRQIIAGLADAGLRPRVDAQRAELELIQAQQSLQWQLIGERAAAAALATALGQDPTFHVRAAGEAEDAWVTPADPAEVIRLALDHRPELRQYRQLLDAAHAAHRAALAARWPTLGVTASSAFTYLSPLADDQFAIEGSQYDLYAGLSLRWSALDASVWRRADVTASAVAEARSRLEALVLSIKAEAADAAHGVQAARAQSELTAQLIAAAQVTRTVQEQRYRGGQASLLELLDAEELEQRARRQRIEADRDLQLARVTLLAACGLTERLTR